MGWERGRQNYYYQKMKIFQVLKLDCYLIKYGPGTAVSDHTDPVAGHKHYRMNIQLRGKCRFSSFVSIIWHSKRIILFRADKNHCMKPSLEKGLILSIGLAKRMNNEVV